jgi:hypothetical protein
MTRRGRRRFACALLTVPLAACSSGEADRSPLRAGARDARPGTTTRAVDSAPAILDRGPDPVAIVRSLLLFGRWIEAARPDPSLVPRAYAPASGLARGMVAVCHAMRRERRRIVEVDRAPLAISPVSRGRAVVSFRVTEHLERRALVDLRGRVIERVGPATEHYVVSMVRLTPTSPWRLSLVEPRGPRVEVQL